MSHSEARDLVLDALEQLLDRKDAEDRSAGKVGSPGAPKNEAVAGDYGLDLVSDSPSK